MARSYWLCVLVVFCAVRLARADDPLPHARPVPEVQVLPLPHDQASFTLRGGELTRYHFGRDLRRPFWYPLTGPAARSLTRMGHPHDPVTHSHHNSVWISHESVAGTNFWTDHGKNLGRVELVRVEKFDDGDDHAAMLTTNHWLSSDDRPLLVERRRCEVRPIDDDTWLMLVDLQFMTPGDAPVEIGQSPFGMIGVRLAKTIGVHDGGGRILNSAGAVGEEAVFRKSAKWVDYSGPVTNELRGGITLCDHPQNPNHPTPFHVRSDGWMGVCLTLNAPLQVTPKQPLRLRYGLWMHAGVPNQADCEARWQKFAEQPLADLKPLR